MVAISRNSRRPSVRAFAARRRRWSLVKRTRLAWHRMLIAQQNDGTGRRSPGRPPVKAEIRELIVRMASENRDWGTTRIQGALANLNRDAPRGTVATVLRAAWSPRRMG